MARAMMCGGIVVDQEERAPWLPVLNREFFTGGVVVERTSFCTVPTQPHATRRASPIPTPLLGNAGRRPQMKPPAAATR